MSERQESGRSSRSVSDEAVDAFSEAYLIELLSRVGTASLPSTSAVRAGLEAATAFLLPTREEIERKVRERLLNSNFTSIRHEPLRTQVVDQWADVLAGTFIQLFSTTSTKGETQS